MSLLKRLLGTRSRPRLSLIVVVYEMAAQAEKTLYSLSHHYQKGVQEDDYEVIVVENSSGDVLGREVVERQGTNFSYYYREEKLPSPVPAARFGVARATGNMLGLMIDGARMATPGLVENVLKASLTHSHALISIPGYHLGHEVQQEAMQNGYDETAEARLLDSINWPDNGYRLFDIACFSRSGGQGYLRPNAESNCLCMGREVWDMLEGIDSEFIAPGGGLANLDLYKRACEHPATELLVIPGEGTFHQFHGGVTTGTLPDEREEIMRVNFAEYRSLRGCDYEMPATQARLYGAVTTNAMKFLRQSVEACSRAASRADR